jgi:hypothetical protein
MYESAAEAAARWRSSVSRPTLSIVVPVYNEEENLPLLLDAIAKSVDPKASPPR